MSDMEQRIADHNQAMETFRKYNYLAEWWFKKSKLMFWIAEICFVGFLVGLLSGNDRLRWMSFAIQMCGLVGQLICSWRFRSNGDKSLKVLENDLKKWQQL